MSVQIMVIGVVRHGDSEMRLQLEAGGWRPDLFVNHATESYGEPPPCFRLKEDDEAALWATWNEMRQGDGKRRLRQ